MFHHAMMGGYLKPTPLKPYMTYDDHLVWPIHVPRRCEPLITPHLSLWGNARTKATFPTHKKNHNPHPQGGEREGGQDGYITLGGVGGWPAKPGSYIYIHTHMTYVSAAADLHSPKPPPFESGSRNCPRFLSVSAHRLQMQKQKQIGKIVKALDLGWFGCQCDAAKERSGKSGKVSEWL